MDSRKLITYCQNPSFWFFVCLILQILIIVHYGNRKLNLFGDEIWTFNLANRYFEPFIGDASRYYNQWLDWNFWNQTLTVLPEHRFSFASVFYNQAHDVHPPFYYLVIHTICSFFPEQFSKWFGIVPNIIFFIITQIIIWLESGKLFSNRWMALLVCSFYGFSWGTINNIVYIRMYAMLTVWAVLSYILHLRLLKSFSYKCYLAILMVSFLGIMTQYYFLIYEFFISLGYCSFLLVKKRYKILFLYSFGFLLLLFFITQFYPPIIDQLLGKVGNQGQAAMQNMKGSDFSHRVSLFGHIISKDLFGAHIVWVARILLLLFLGKLFSYFGKISLRKDRLRKSFLIKFSIHSCNHEFIIEENYLNLCMIYSLFCSLGYFCVIAKIAPYMESRYLVIIHPIIATIFIYILKKVQEAYTIEKKYFIIFFLIMLILFGIKMYKADNLFAYDRQYSNITKAVEQQDSEIALIVITKDKSWWPTINEALTLRDVNTSYMIQEDEMDSLPDILKEYWKTHPALLLYRGFDCKMNEQEFVQKIRMEFQFKSVQKLDSYKGEVYLVK